MEEGKMKITNSVRQWLKLTEKLKDKIFLGAEEGAFSIDEIVLTDEGEALVYLKKTPGMPPEKLELLFKKAEKEGKEGE
jgi:hypothetical protein